MENLPFWAVLIRLPYEKNGSRWEWLYAILTWREFGKLVALSSLNFLSNLKKKEDWKPCLSKQFWMRAVHKDEELVAESSLCLGAHRPLIPLVKSPIRFDVSDQGTDQKLKQSLPVPCSNLWSGPDPCLTHLISSDEKPLARILRWFYRMKSGVK